MRKEGIWNKGMLLLFVAVLLTALIITMIYSITNEKESENTELKLGDHISWKDGYIRSDGRGLLPVAMGDLKFIGILPYLVY